MIAWMIAMLCGIVGSVSTHVVYIRSNLFIVGDLVRRSRHSLYDPLAFVGFGLIWGLLVGGLCGFWLRASHPVIPTFAGLGVTLAGVLVVGGIATWQRYLALPVDSELPGGPIQMEFELRLPPGRDSDLGFPVGGQIGSGPRNTTYAKLLPKLAQQVDGRFVLPGIVVVRSARAEQLLQFDDPNWGWVPFEVLLVGLLGGQWSVWISPTNAQGDSDPEYDFQMRYRKRGPRARFEKKSNQQSTPLSTEVGNVPSNYAQGRP